MKGIMASTPSGLNPSGPVGENIIPRFQPECIISQLADSAGCQLRKEAEKLADF